MAKDNSERLAPVEEGAFAPAAEKRRPDPKPLQRAWGALGAATGSALLATIVGPMVASATGGFSLDGTSVTDEPATTGDAVEASPAYVYLAPGEVAPEGAPVVQLDPITVVASPTPGSTVVAVKPKPKVVYIYLKPGETPPAGAIVQQAGEVAAVKPSPDSGGTPAATPKPDPIATPAPDATPRPTPRPTPAPTPPPTRPSGG
jgi:hypothetical protein